ncbi:MAG: PIN domain nuclease [candidate division Zixibacteria bacterium]|nr:PIN domain nuclease [candidate division Zixibacteria bacterium]
MKRLSLYLDTSILNFAIADDVPREKEVTLRLLDEVRRGKYGAFISEIVDLEIGRAPQKIAARLRDLVKELNPEELSVDENVELLSDRYIEEGVIPAKYEDDALHIAIASVNNLDVIVSWNFEHIVKLKTKREVNAVNVLLGYDPIEIVEPAML